MKEWEEIARHSEFVILFLTLVGGFYLLDGKIETQSQRADKLYEIYTDIQKDVYDIRKEKRINT